MTKRADFRVVALPAGGLATWGVLLTAAGRASRSARERALEAEVGKSGGKWREMNFWLQCVPT